VVPEPLEEIEDWMINFLSLGFDAEEEEGDELSQALGDAGEKLGHWLTEKAGWLGEQLKTKVDELDIDVDPKDLGHRLGRKLADAKVEAARSAKDFEKIARDKVEEVVDEVKAEAKHLATEVKSKVNRKK
jgi:hypothetical protein